MHGRDSGQAPSTRFSRLIRLRRDRAIRPVHLTRAFGFFLLVSGLFLSGCGVSRDPDDLREMIGEGRHSEAVPVIESLLDENPDDVELNRLYGQALFSGGNPSLALWPLNKVLESGEASPQDYVVTATAHLRGGSPTEAVLVSSQVLEEYPDLLEALEVRITSYRQLNKMKEALEDVEFILERRPDDFRHQINRLELLFTLEHPEDEIERAIALAKASMDGSPLAQEWEVRFCALDASFVFEREEEGYIEKASEIWDGCLLDFPANPLIVNEAVAFHDGQGDFRRSREILEVAMEAAPEVSDFRFSLASRLNDAGQLDRAEELIEEFPDEALNGAASWELVDYYVTRDDYGSAVAVLNKTFESLEEGAEQSGEPVPEALRLEYVDLLIRAGEFDLAEGEVEKLEKPEFKNMMKGRLALSRNEPLKALAYLDEAIRFWPGNSVARQLAGEAAERAGDFDRARAEYLEAVRNGTDNLEALEKLASIYKAMGDVGALKQLMGLYIDSNPTDPRGYELQFEVGLWSGNPAMAGSAVEGLYLVPGRGPMALALAAKFNGLGQPAKAVEFIRAADVDLLQPAMAPVLEVMVDSLLSMGRVSEAVALASRAATKTPGYPRLHEIRGRALMEDESQLAEAQAAFEEAFSLNPRSVEALIGLAGVLAKQDQIDEALARYQEAAQVDWMSPVAEWGALDLLAANDRIAERDALLEILVQEHGEDVEGVLLLARRIVEQEGDLERAKSLAERAIQLQGGSKAQELLEEIALSESPEPSAAPAS